MLLLLIASGLAVVAMSSHLPIAGLPMLPSKAQLSTLSGDSLQLKFEGPIHDGGSSAVHSYQVIYALKSMCSIYYNYSCTLNSSCTLNPA
jgi:hypothetical protein